MQLIVVTYLIKFKKKRQWNTQCFPLEVLKNKAHKQSVSVHYNLNYVFIVFIVVT